MKFLVLWEGWSVISAIGTFIAAIVAILYTIFTYLLLQKSKETFDKANEINEFQIYKEISNTLSTDEVSRLTDLCMSNRLVIDYYNLTTVVGDKVNSTNLNRHLLNLFEDVAIYWHKKLINIKIINAGFGYKILKIGNCKTITNHILKMRESLPNVYWGFENLYNAIILDSPESEKVGCVSTLFPVNVNSEEKKK